MEQFRIAGGSVPGTYHTKPGQPGWGNNQDAFAWQTADDYLVAVVCDGCGSMPYSEVGSRIGSRVLLAMLARALKQGDELSLADALSRESLLTELRDGLAEAIAGIARSMDDAQRIDYTVMEHFLFTIMLVAMNAKDTMICSFGDGVYSLNGNTVTVDPAVGNAPPYIGQRLVPGLMDEKFLEFRVQALLPTNEVESVLIGTDGLSYFQKAEHLALPGKEDLVGPLSQFWTNRHFADNPDAIRRRLAMANRDTVIYELDTDGRLAGSPRIKPGLLHDDTTLVLITREKPQEG